MTSLLLDSELPFVFVPIIFMFVFAVFIISFAAKYKKDRTEREARTHTERAPIETQPTNPKPYLDTLRERQSQRRGSAHETEHHHVGNSVVSNTDGHTHVGSDEEEVYDVIVGSLGEVNDEGCVDLNGIRLIAHDIAYDTENGKKRDYSKVVSAAILGDVINTPRFKKPYGRK